MYTDPLALRLGAVICVGLSLDLLLLSAFCDLFVYLSKSTLLSRSSPDWYENAFLKGFVSRVSVAPDFNNSVA
jgi:hypothetical protein